MQSLLLRLRAWWETADRTQKSVTIFGSLFLVLLLAGTLYFSSRPKMEVLFRGLSPQDQGMVVNELTKLGVPYEQDRAGNVMVPQDRVAEVQGKLAVAQKMPSSGHPGYSDLKEMGVMNTPSVERERLKSMTEGELARSIETLAGVKSARVHLTLQDTSPFARSGSAASASVIVTESSEGALDGEGARAIQRLVQYSVSGLQPKNISVISNSGRTLIDGNEAIGGSGLVAERLQAEIAEARRRETLLQSRLDTAFGKGATVVSIPILEMSFDQKAETKDEQSPTKPLTIDKVTETMSDSDASVGGVAGAAANTPGAAPANSENEGRNYSGQTESKTFATTETRTNTTYAPGTLKKMAINVLVNSTVIEDPAAVEQIIRGELGPLASDTTNFGFTVTPIAFDTKAAEESKKSEAAAASTARTQQIFSLLPIVALVIVGFMVVKAIGKASKGGTTMVAALPGGGMIPVGQMPSVETKILIEDNGQQVAVPMGSQQALAAEKEGKVLGTVQAPVVRHGELVGDAEGKVLSDKHQEVVEFVGNDQAVRIAKIPDQVNVPLEQIKRMATDKPEVVAMLLKTWLLNEGK